MLTWYLKPKGVWKPVSGALCVKIMRNQGEMIMNAGDTGFYTDLFWLVFFMTHTGAFFWNWSTENNHCIP